MRHKFGFLAGQGALVEHLSVAAGDQARETVDAGDQAAAIAGHRETREGPELGGHGVARDLRGALETDHS